jgi:hypothetical protein
MLWQWRGPCTHCAVCRGVIALQGGVHAPDTAARRRFMVPAAAMASKNVRVVLTTALTYARAIERRADCSHLCAAREVGSAVALPALGGRPETLPGYVSAAGVTLVPCTRSGRAALTSRSQEPEVRSAALRPRAMAELKRDISAIFRETTHTNPLRQMSVTFARADIGDAGPQSAPAPQASPAPVKGQTYAAPPGLRRRALQPLDDVVPVRVNRGVLSGTARCESRSIGATWGQPVGHPLGQPCVPDCVEGAHRLSPCIHRAAAGRARPLTPPKARHGHL